MSSELRFSLADRLRKAREHAGLEQLALAQLLGISESTVSNYERGRTRPSLEFAVRWADATDASLEWIARGNEQRKAVA